jgi:hypothetical protein
MEGWSYGRCKHCPLTSNNVSSNPDFSTWDGFGWMIERVEGIVILEVLSGFYCAHIVEQKTIDSHVKIIHHPTFRAKDYPTALFEALCEYHGIKEEL